MTRQPTLYQLLPEYIRFQDQENGQALEALMSVLDLEFERLNAGMDRLYDDWFIETCQSWLVPFFGDLVGLDRLARSSKEGFSLRPLVGKMIARRRYKGTVTCLEHTASDATGWSCLARWQADTLGWTQDVRATRPDDGGFLSLRDSTALERLNTSFDSSSHTVDLRSEPGTSQRDAGCRYHPLWVSAWFWRIEARPIWRGAARQVGEGCYTFDPFGQDVPLYMQPRARPGEREATKEIDLPLPLRTSTLARLLDELRQSEVRGQVAISPIRTWLEIYDADQGCPIPLRSIIACDLEDWRRPGQDETICCFDGALGYDVEYPVLAAVDPERGRLTLATTHQVKTAEEQAEVSAHVLASYSCGLGYDIGGGPEHQVQRKEEVDAWRALVLTTPGTRSPDYAGPPVFASLTEALAAWPKEAEKAHLRIMGSGRLEASGGLWDLDLDGRQLTLEATEGSRPLLAGQLKICGRRLSDTKPGHLLPRLRLAGLWLDGDIEIQGGIELDIESSTLGPPLARAFGAFPAESARAFGAFPAESARARGRSSQAEAVPRSQGILRASKNTRALIRVKRSILGPIRIPSECAACEIFDSVIDGALWHGGDAMAYAGVDAQDPGPPMVLERTTVLGMLHAQSIEAWNVYFCRHPEIARTSIGFLKHCFVPPGDGKLPTQSHQLPPASSNPCCLPPGWEAAESSENWLVSIRYGNPGYALPSSSAPRALLTGGTDGSAIGVTHHLHEAQRAERLPTVFENTLRSGMQARVVWVDGRPTETALPQQPRHHRRTNR